MEDTITIKLSPLLSDELLYSVETWLNDPKDRKTPAEQSFGDKVMENPRKLKLTLPEAAALWNEFWSMEDKISEWAQGGDPTDVRWFAVHQALKRKMNELEAFGVEVDVHGWAKV